MAFGSVNGDGGSVSPTAPAGVSLSGSTLSVDPSDAAFNHLGVGEHTTIVVSYNITDAQGATVAQTETVTITGQNDGPVAVAETATAVEDGAVVTGQLAGSLPQGEGLRVSVAYEPVWAIGTGRVPSVEDVSAMHRAIRAHLLAVYGEAGAMVRILYGGSVNAGNAAELLRADEVNGALVGGASLTVESFAAIIAAAGALSEG